MAMQLSGALHQPSFPHQHKGEAASLFITTLTTTSQYLTDGKT